MALHAVLRCAVLLSWDHFPVLQLRDNAPTKLKPFPNGTPRVVYGLEGYDRKIVEIFLSGCMVRNDQAPTKPAEQPPPTAIVSLAALLHCQVCVGE